MSMRSLPVYVLILCICSCSAPLENGTDVHISLVPPCNQSNAMTGIDRIRLKASGPAMDGPMVHEAGVTGASVTFPRVPAVSEVSVIAEGYLPSGVQASPASAGVSAVIDMSSYRPVVSVPLLVGRVDSFIRTTRLDGEGFGGCSQPSYDAAGEASVLLPDGRVLITGGVTGESRALSYIKTITVFDPAKGTYEKAADMLFPRAYHTATLINAGTYLEPRPKVLIVGGVTSGEATVAVVESFDLTSWKMDGVVAVLGMGVAHHTATRLSGGDVVIIGGQQRKYVRGVMVTSYSDSITVYRSGEKRFEEAVATLQKPRAWHAATLMEPASSGEVVYVTGGFNGSTGEPSVETFENGRSYTLTTPDRQPLTMMDRRYGHVAVGMGDTLVVTGGYVMGKGGTLFDSYSISWRTEVLRLHGKRAATREDGPNMSEARAMFTASEIPGGRVLLAGGTGAAGVPIGSAEIMTLSWGEAGKVIAGITKIGARMSAERSGHTAVTLGSGQVLISGGDLYNTAPASP